MMKRERGQFEIYFFHSDPKRQCGVFKFKWKGTMLTIVFADIDRIQAIPGRDDDAEMIIYAVPDRKKQIGIEGAICCFLDFGLAT